MGKIINFKGKDGKVDLILISLIALEIVIIFLFMLQVLFPNINLVTAGVGTNNVTVSTTLQIGNVYPEILSITVNGGSAITLTANATTNVVMYMVIRDYNGEADIVNVTGRFFDNVASSYSGTPDNNNHHRNDTCTINTAYGNSYEANATCIFSVQYFANNATWNGTGVVRDNGSLSDTNFSLATINTLLALGLPNTIDYGLVNATNVSDEKIANVTNFGNVIFNLSLSGYAVTVGDNLAMNCTIGNVQNISIEHEKYNVTTGNSTSGLSLGQVSNYYLNLSSSVVTKTFNLLQRQNDTQAYVDDTNSTYWRIYVPRGVAGNCTGNIVFGAVQASGT